MISTCILPQIEATSFDSYELEQFYEYRQTFLNQSQQMVNLNKASQKSTDQTPCSIQVTHADANFLNASPQTRKSNRLYQDCPEIVFPYNQFHRFIELAWISSTVVGIFLFLVEIGLVCYIKFYPISFFAALTGAIVMTPILILFVIFTITFYRRLADFKLGLTKHYLHQVDRNLHPFNENVI